MNFAGIVVAEAVPITANIAVVARRYLIVFSIHMVRGIGTRIVPWKGA
jgi:hypothetical protein